jgi:hypothetical protein
VGNLIKKYEHKKLVEYLSPNMRILLRFGHGLGDTLMFLPLYKRLQDLYPDVHFDLYVESGQEEIWGTCTNKDSPDHDYIFHLDFPMSEGSGYTKAEWCCIRELGIEPPNGIHPIDTYDSPLVAVHFQGTALPGSVNCHPDIARMIWNEIVGMGKVPIEVHYEHLFHNPVNTQYPFITNTLRGCHPSISRLIGVIQRCSHFIGVASGPFVVALATIPDTTLLLEHMHKLTDYVKDKGKAVSLNMLQSGYISRFIRGDV